MSASLIYESAKLMWSDSSFQKQYKSLRRANIRHNLNIIETTEIDFSNLLRAASLFSLISDSEKESNKFHEAAFRIAYVTDRIWHEKPKNLQIILALILSRLGNFPTISMQMANGKIDSFLDETIQNLPYSFSLETLARYEGNTIKVHDGELVLTDFQC